MDILVVLQHDNRESAPGTRLQVASYCHNVIERARTLIRNWPTGSSFRIDEPTGQVNSGRP